jgi:hypothetical protein
LAVDSSLSLTGLLVKPAQVTFSATSTLTLAGLLQRVSALSLQASSSLSCGASTLRLGAIILTGVATVIFIAGTQVTIVAVAVGKTVKLVGVAEGADGLITVGPGDSTTVNVTI